MASSAPTVEELEWLFPQTLIPKIQGEPTYEKLYEIQKRLMENAAAIESAYRGGNHSHLGLIIPPVRHHQEAGQNFVIPLRDHPHRPCQYNSCHKQR
eukprot:13196742-Ditylum_brightwellii.AAC.1